MNRITYSAAQNIPEALEQLTAHDNAKFIAGGTNLIDLMKINVMRPDHLVDINKTGLNDIRQQEDGGLILGALVTNADTAYNELVSNNYPLLAEAMLSAASAQLRNMATNGGNILQRTRCYYFYDTATACNKREPGSGCSAIHGLNRMHAILGTSEHCIAVHPSDMAVALTALDASVQLSGPQGEREIPISEFHRLPENHPEQDTNIQQEEMIKGIKLPASAFSQHYTYLKLRDRPSYAFALVSVAAAFQLDGSGNIVEARIALGGVAHKPWRKPEAEALLQGKPASTENFSQAAAILMEGAKGYGHNDFKIELAKRAIVRALEQALTQNNS
jgi:xanthine dehydrogenase YagS FAD-binding subunit